MAKATLSSLLIFSILFLIAANLASALNKDICQLDSDPEKCKQTIESLPLQIEKDPIGSIRHIINFGLERAQALKADMSHWVRTKGIRANEHAALKDCLDDIDEGIEDLRKAIKEVEEAAKAKNENNMSELLFLTGNLETWLKAFLNSIESCKDGFSMPGLDGPVKEDVLKKLPDMSIPTQIAVWTIKLPVTMGG